MEEQTLLPTRQEIEILFTGHAIQGLLAANDLMGQLPEELAKRAIKIGKTVAAAMYPEEEFAVQHEESAERAE